VDLIATWATLFDEHGLDVALESDAHVVKMTWPIRPDRGPGSEAGFIRDDRRGTVYMGEGCWGAPLRENNNDKSWTRNSGSFNQFKWIFVDASRMEMRTVRIDNAASVAAVAASNPFAIPRGLDLWQPSNGGVVTIYPRYSGRTTTTASAAAPPVAPPPTRVTASSATPNQLACEPNGQLTFTYRLPQPGQVDVLIVDADNRLIFKDSKPGQGPGPYSRSANLGNLPKGMYSLIIKLNGKVLTTYRVRR
jgi:hypothetical protein